MENKTKTPKISIKASVQLAAPHTWPAAVLPVLLGAAIHCGLGGALRPWLLLCTLAVAVLLQSAVNTLNDYVDFVSGLDSAENCPDTSDAALVYECSSPRAALILGLLFLLGAAALGGLLVWQCGFALLIYAALAILAILLYTLPGISLSNLPVGELLSGGAMGGVLTCAAYHAQAGAFDPKIIPLCLPAFIMIGGIMLVNNTADIEKDIEGGRKTLPVCVGRKAAQRILRSAIVFSALCVAAITLLRFSNGAAALPAMLAALLIDPNVKGLFTLPVVQQRRPACMRGILRAHVCINACYVAALLLDSLVG